MQGKLKPQGEEAPRGISSEECPGLPQGLESEMEFLFLLLRGLGFLVIADAILSWFVPREKFPRNLTGPLLEPIYTPIRKLIPPEKMGGFDLAPLALLFGLQLLAQALR